MLRRLQKFQAASKNLIRYNLPLRTLVTLRMLNYRFPSVLGIEPTNICNLNCKICVSGQNQSAPGMMSMTLFNRIIEESLQYGKRWMIILHNLGEPLVHPEIAQMVRIIKRKKAARLVQFATNGLLATEDILNELIGSGVDSITFSIDAYSRQDYSDLKGMDGLEQVKKNAMLLMALKKKRKSALPWVCAKMVRRRGFEHTFKPFLEEWSKIVDEALMTPYSNWGGDIPYEGTDQIRRKRYACHFLWYYPVISCDGGVLVCCATVSPKAIIGNINQRNLHDIWTGEELKRIRQAHLKKDFGRIPYCSGCTYWTESKVNLDYFLRA